MRSSFLLAGLACLAVLALQGASADQGNDSTTGAYGYVWVNIPMNYEEIRTSGQLKVSLDDQIVTADFNAGEPSGSAAFTFKFFGTTYGASGANDAWVSDNGFFSFQSNAAATFIAPYCPGGNVPCPPIPSTTHPRAMIAPYSFNGVPNCPGNVNPPAGSTQKVYSDTKGAEPDRRFIVEWDAVGVSDGGAVTVSAGGQTNGGKQCNLFQTMQAKIFEGSDIFEFHNPFVSVVSPPGATCPTGVQGGQSGGQNSAASQAIRIWAYACTTTGQPFMSRAFRVWPNNANDASDQTVEVLPSSITDVVLATSDDPLTYTKITNPTAGTVTNFPEGQLLYGKAVTIRYTAPPVAQCGSYTFVYKVGDTYDADDTATVTFKVLCPNVAPVNKIPAAGVLIRNDQTWQWPTGSFQVSDADAGTLDLSVQLSMATPGTGTIEILNPGSVTLTGTNPGPSLTLQGPVTALNAALAQVKYAPEAGVCSDNGPFALRMDTDDLGNYGTGGAREDSDQVPITVTDCPEEEEPNEPPVAEDVLVTMQVTEREKAFAFDATDPEGHAITIQVVSQVPGSGLVSIDGLAGSYARYPFTCGTDTLTYTATDEKGAVSNRATVLYTLLCAPNRKPVASDSTFLLRQDEGRYLPLQASDPDLTIPAILVRTPPANGVLSGTGLNLHYQPDAGFCGTDTFQFVASDGQLESSLRTVTLRVACPQNHPPQVRSDVVTTPYGTPVRIDLWALDPDGDPLGYTLFGSVQHGTLTGAAPTFTYTPAEGFTGSDAFSYQVQDGQANSDVATILVTVLQPAAGAADGYVAPAASADRDGDGFPDTLDPCPATPTAFLDDANGNGFADGCEPARTVGSAPEAMEPDADGDLVADRADICPSVPDPHQLDLDGDGTGDACDTDSDGDGIPNPADNCPGIVTQELADLDGDGRGDFCDPDDDADGIPDAAPAGTGDNCPRAANPAQADADGDGAGDACDIDSDSDGLADQPAALKRERLAADAPAVAERGGLGPAQGMLLGGAMAFFAGCVALVWARRRGDGGM